MNDLEIAEPRFRLLGAITAHAGPGKGTLDLGHDRQRCVLTALLVDANRPVPVPVLLDRAWGDRLPQHPREALYSCLSRLRQALSAAGARLARDRGGYTIELEPLDIDLHRFDDLVRRAGHARDPGQALACLEPALALWTGDAFGTLDTPWLNGQRRELARRRSAAEGDRDDHALALGRHQQVLPDLLGRAAREPLDERLAGRVLLALYRCGQQAQALTHYEGLRRLLAAELGTEPGPPLRRLHHQILCSDPALDAPILDPSAPAPPAELPVAPVVPRQLPPVPATFTGRAAELARLTAAFEATRGAVAVAAVCGAGGIGKTWLVLRWAHRHSERFPDGQLYVNLRGFDPVQPPLEPAAAVRSFLGALGLPAAGLPPDPESQVAMYRSLLAGRRVLVVLDDARDSAQVAPLLPGSPGCAVLVTSRRRLTGLVTAHDARPVALGPLTDAAARDLLRARLGEDQLSAATDAVDVLVAHCAGLPLALGIVAARAATDPAAGLGGLAADLAETGSRLDLLDAGELALGLRAVLDSSVRTVSAPAARLFTRLGLAPGPEFGVAAAASAAGTPSPDVRRLLRELADVNLINENVPQRYRIHDLVRLYAIELATAAGERPALARLLDHYLHTAHAASRLLRPLERQLALPPPVPGTQVEPLADRTGAIAWFALERQALPAMVRAGAAAGFDRQVWQLAWACLSQFDERGELAALIEVADLALGAARRLADDTALAYAHSGLARGYLGLGRFDDARAELDHSLAAFRRLGDAVGEGFAYRRLARVDALQGRPAAALEQDRLALARFEAAGHDHGRAVALNALGWHFAHLGRHVEAVDCCRRAIDLQRDLADPVGEAMTWDSLAYAWYRKGSHEQAVTAYRRAARLLHDQLSHYLEAQVTEHLGDAYAALGAWRSAHRAWQRSADLLAALGHPAAEPVRAKIRQASNGPRGVA